MALFDGMKRLFGVSPVRVAEINRTVTRPLGPVPASDLAEPSLAEIEVTPEYRSITSLLEAGCPLIFVTGKAGTGKSTLIAYLRQAQKLRMAVVAPTGVAALNAKGTTIHSFFRFPPRLLTKEDIRQVFDRKLYSKLDLLIVDEISMVRVDVVDAMDRFLRMNGRDQSKPFGGAQLVLIGDLFQLPPVVPNPERSALTSLGYRSPYFFSAKSLQETSLWSVELTKTFRQTDGAFVRLLDKVRVAEDLNEVLPILNTRCVEAIGSSVSLLTLTCTNAAADAINALSLRDIPSPSLTFFGEISGTFQLQEARLPSPLNLTLKAGAQVMFTQNDGTGRWVNGTVGKVVGLDSGSIQVRLLTGKPSQTFSVSKAVWESYRYIYDEETDRIRAVSVGKYTQYPLMLAWAVTIHKGQGKTLESVRVDFGTGAFAYGQAYVALSRCRSLADVVLSRPIQPSDVKCDPMIKAFYRTISQPRDLSEATDLEG